MLNSVNVSYLRVSVPLRSCPLSPATKTGLGSSVLAPLVTVVERTHFVNVLIVCELKTLTGQHDKLVLVTSN